MCVSKLKPVKISRDIWTRGTLFCTIFAWALTGCYGQYYGDHSSHNDMELRSQSDTDFSDDVLSRERRTLVYPGTSNLLLIYGLGTPIQLEQESVILGVFTKLLYALPDNSTYYTEPGIYYARSTKSRWSIYKVLQAATKVLGYGGKECLLRSICEAANVPFNANHGLFGELVHTFLTPSTTKEEPDDYEDRDYHAAERLGREIGDHCSVLYPECKISILDIFTQVGYQAEETCDLLKGITAPGVWKAHARAVEVRLVPNKYLFSITFGLSTPIELNLKDRAMVYSLGFQLQFALPYNLTQLTPTIVPARSTRDLTLQDTYGSIENLLDENGWDDGRECLLRSICELAEAPLDRDGQDLIEEVIHLLLTPSEDLPEAFDFNHRSVHEMYHEAERLGRVGGDCILAYPDCIKSPLESFTEVLR